MVLVNGSEQVVVRSSSYIPGPAIRSSTYIPGPARKVSKSKSQHRWVTRGIKAGEWIRRAVKTEKNDVTDV